MFTLQAQAQAAAGAAHPAAVMAADAFEPELAATSAAVPGADAGAEPAGAAADAAVPEVAAAVAAVPEADTAIPPAEEAAPAAVGPEVAAPAVAPVAADGGPAVPAADVGPAMPAADAHEPALLTGMLAPAHGAVPLEGAPLQQHQPPAVQQQPQPGAVAQFAVQYMVPCARFGLDRMVERIAAAAKGSRCEAPAKLLVKLKRTQLVADQIQRGCERVVARVPLIVHTVEATQAVQDWAVQRFMALVHGRGIELLMRVLLSLESAGQK